MGNAYDALMTIKQTMKFYDLCLEGVRQRHELTKIEVIIISFLFNNPGHDTVGEIADMRMLSKGNVSRGADALIRRGLLARRPDESDRRWVHLTLLPAASPIVEEIQTAAAAFAEKAFEGFTPADMEIWQDLNIRLTANVTGHLERSADKDGE